MCKKYRGYFKAPFLDDFDILMFLLLWKSVWDSSNYWSRLFIINIGDTLGWSTLRAKMGVGCGWLLFYSAFGTVL
jgi:hypothetical protein